MTNLHLLEHSLDLFSVGLVVELASELKTVAAHKTGGCTDVAEKPSDLVDVLTQNVVGDVAEKSSSIKLKFKAVPHESCLLFLMEIDATATEEVKKSSHVQRKFAKRQHACKIDPHIEDQLSTCRLLAAISSRPGHCGRADGYILEVKELEFYMKKIQKKKGKSAVAPQPNKEWKPIELVL